MTAFFTGLVDFIGTHPQLAVVIVFLIAAGEAVFIVGLFVPSTVVLVGAGTLVGMGQLSFWPIFIASSLGATVGDGLSFWIGHVHKDRLKQVWPFSRFRGLIEHGERFFLRHGGKSIFIARFLPGVKSVVPVIAGMMGMGLGRFAAINVVSAFAWTAVHILPAIGLGRGVSVFGAGNPRLVALVVIVVVLGLVAWYVLKLSVVWLGPGVGRLHRASVDRLAESRSRPLRVVHRLLTNEDRIIVAVAWSALGLLATFGFAAVVLNLLLKPELVTADQAISNFVQSLRNVSADAGMIAVTMIGDSLVLSALAVTVVLAFAVYGHWRGGGAILLAIAGTAAFVPLLRSILQRPRPTALYSGAEAFSFPSGHATLSMTVFGIIAVILADGRPPRVRFAIYLSTALLLGAIAISRVYLGAHWPSDVVAGFLFGLAMVSIVAFLLHQMAIPLPAGRIAVACTVVFAVTYTFDLMRNYGSWTDAYGHHELPVAMSEPAWLQSGWRSLPQRRILLDGETGEPFIVQTDIPVGQVASELKAAGWQRFPPPTLVDVAVILIPSPMSIAGQPPLPNLHDGREPAITLAKASQADAAKRYVLRLWTSGTEVGSPSSPTPILIGSITVEVEEPWVFGLTSIDPGQLTLDERTRLEAELEATLGAMPAVAISRAGQEPFLASRR